MNRIVVGVVGGTGNISDDTKRLSYAIGWEIARRRWILLTGGHPDERNCSVKKCAMTGALQKSTAARMLGIIRHTEQRDTAQWSFAPRGNEPQKYLYTNLGDRRNALNGSTPDVLLALKGGAGTLSEIAYACTANRPVVFVDSYEHLKCMREEEAGKLKKIVKEISNDKNLRDITETSRDVLWHLDQLLTEPILVVPASTDAGATAKTACEKASTANRVGRFPTLKTPGRICKKVNDWLTWARGDTSSH